MLSFLDHLSQYLVLHVRHLDCLKHDFPVEHTEIWSEVSCQAIIPILKVASRASRSLLPTLRLHPRYRVVELKLGSKASIVLILEAVHEGAIPGGLCRVILDAIIADNARISILKWLLVSITAAVLVLLARIGGTYFVADSVEVHFMKKQVSIVVISLNFYSISEELLLDLN